MPENAILAVDMNKVRKTFKNREILRQAMQAETDATSFYEQLADSTDDPAMKEILLDVAKEEKTHFGEFLSLLLAIDEEQMTELKAGTEEVKQKTAKIRKK